MKPATAIWLRRADEDLAVAQLCKQSSLAEPLLFHCQQALEKLLKAFEIERNPQDIARRTHDLVDLASAIEPSLTEEQLLLLRRLTNFYIPTRYGEDQLDWDQDTMQEWLRQTQELFSWLRRRLN